MHDPFRISHTHIKKDQKHILEAVQGAELDLSFPNVGKGDNSFSTPCIVYTSRSQMLYK